MWILLGFAIGFIFAKLLTNKNKFAVGDIVYLKPTNRKYIIYGKHPQLSGHWVLADMNCEPIDSIPFHERLFIKVENDL
jgi:hypothetical protein